MRGTGEGIARALAALREDEGALLDWLVRFVQTASVFDPVAGTTEEPAARLVHELLTGWGWSPLWEEAAPGRPNVVARRQGAIPGARHLIVEGHTDVVTPGEPSRWTHPPFAGVIADGKLHGRGTADMKAGLAAGLFAVRAIERAGVPFAGRITLAVVADEEGLMTGIKAFVARGHADGATAALVCEPEGGRVCIAQKGVLRCRVTARGRMAHGAMPESGANPVPALADFLHRCGELEQAIQADAGEHPYLGKFYLTPTVIAAGEAAQVNVISDEAVAYLDIRTTPLTPHAPVLAHLRAAIRTVEAAYPGRTLLLDCFEDRPPTDTDPAEPLVAATVAAHRAEYGAVPPFGGVPGSTDGTILWRERRIPIVVYGPGDVTIPHQVDEFVRIDEVLASARVYVRAILGYLVRDEGPAPGA
ncbi:MAG: M20 family metallopeptidase [Thermomicrobiales bacterium]